MSRCLLAPLVPLLLVGAVATAAPVEVTGPPVAPPLAVDGTGACAASATSGNPATDFGALTTGTYVAGMNAFVEAHAGSRVEAVQATPLDLSNNDSGGLQSSYGDFRDAFAPTCATGGCGFFVNDTTTSFGTRLRGYLNVTSAMTGAPLHFGVYADDAAAVVLVDGAGTAYPVIVRPPVLGMPTWRATNSVTFGTAGLYAIEILYSQIVEHAALEVSLLPGSFADFELPVGQAGSVNLATAGFQLVAPAQLFLTTTGAYPLADHGQCRQCERQYAGSTGGGCGAGSYCGAAALCEPCATDAFCGASCAACGGAAPRCVPRGADFECAACREDDDCSGGTCDPTTWTCVTPQSDAAVPDDAAPAEDGGVPDDAAPDDAAPADAQAADAQAARDGGAADAGGGGTGSGCGCRAGRRAGAGLLALLPLALALRPRRPRR